MIGGRLRWLEEVTGGRLEGADGEFAGATTDTRRLTPGQAFFALRGPRFDAHDFLAEAGRLGAAVAVAERGDPRDLPIVRVDNSLVALGQAAAAWRRRFDIPVAAVTGSAGKTTVKEMLAAIAGQAGPVLATKGNLNNEIGLPLTLFRLSGEHRRAVLEMGANHAGEIRRLTAIGAPDVGVVTMAGPAHLEGFGSIEGVAHAKGELFQGLAPGATAVINADDVYAPLWHEFAGDRPILTFGTRDADVRCDEPVADGSGSQLVEMTGPFGSLRITLRLPGRHNAINALAAAAAAHALGHDAGEIRRGLESVRPQPGRLQIRSGLGGSRLVDDTYNANPEAVRAAVDYLVGIEGRAFLALGDMGELGPGAAEMHAEVGRYARQHGVLRLFAVGELSRHAAEAFGEGASVYDSPAELVAALAEALDADVNLLVKGSRSMRMERVVEALETARGASGEDQSC
jgi:UDP-N-acetylmuramoyl-tripeptide--D-alanyl-D-alanine ligase